MIETMVAGCGGGVDVLDASTVAGWRDALALALADPAGDHPGQTDHRGFARTAGDTTAAVDGGAGLVETIRALEELVCVASAAQARLAAELDEVVRADHARLGVPARRQGAGVGALVGYARRESPHRGARHLGLARIVAAELPHTWQAWRSGRIGEWKATLIARETACLSLADRLAVDEQLAADAEALERLGERETGARARALADRLDPAAALTRRRQAESDRHVSLRPAPDTMTWLTALLPVKDGVAAYAALARAADAARAAGDPRGRGQVMADSLTDAVVGHAGRDSGSRARPVQLHLVMTHAALFGSSEESAWLAGFGTIPAELARELVTGALQARERVWLRRLYTDPTTGELTAMEATGREFLGSLARFVRLRDQVCRTPWCQAPIRHLDHAHEATAGGPTSADNGQGLCEACNYAKQAPHWRAGASRDGPGHQIRTVLPTGHTYTTRPPALVTPRHPPLRVDYRFVA